MTLAHGPVTPGELWSAWSFDPPTLALLAAAAGLYAVGAVRMTRRKGRSLRGRQIMAFYGAWLLLATAMVSPLDALAGTLVSAHMVQHLVMLVLAPPLIAYSAPALVMGAGLPRRARRPLRAAARSRPGTSLRALATTGSLVVIVHVAAMWLWHLPGAYEAALGSDLLHAVEHASFLVTAILLWSVLVQPRPRRRAGYGAGIAYAFVVWMVSGGLGALLSFATRPLYPALAAGAGAWGLTAISDQQLAGLIMWVPAGAVYLVAMTVLFQRWMSSLERRTAAAQARDPRLAEAPR